MKEINWNLFKAKFNGRENTSFEYLAYLLFCSEHGNFIGVFRFKNQTGIETEPIQIDNEIVGFQAKFYDTKISDNKGDIIDSIKKAKRENTNLTKLLFYLNQEFSESKTKSKKDPIYKTEIEEAAKELKLKIVWRVPSHFELQLSLPKNQYINNFYFSEEKGVIDFLKELNKHTDRLLFPIQTDIEFGDRTLKINRNSILTSIANSIDKSKMLIVHGEGGCGKTAIIKEFYAGVNENIPFYGFKAAEFNVENINSLFKNYGGHSLSDFIKAHDEEANKIVLVDSAERITDLDNQEPFKEFLSELILNSWRVIFTTRDSYLDDLRFQFLSVFRKAFDEVRIANISSDELTLLATKHSFNLPSNSKLRKLIKNPFYLNEYLRSYSSEGNSSSYLQFKEGVWSRKIQNSSYSGNNIHLKREKCFLNIIREKITKGTFFVSATGCSDDILALITQDEIISFDKSLGGYFITHDIYEEWGQDIIVERTFNSSNDYEIFLEEIGSSLPMRRAFRNWLSDKLYINLKSIKPFIENSIVNSRISSFWKDEILTSILLSEYSIEFFNLFKNSIFTDGKVLLKRVIFLLQISCKEIDKSYLPFFDIEEGPDVDFIITKPKGQGWCEVINLIYKNPQEFKLNSLNYVLPVLNEWSSNYKSGITTKQVGLIALRYYDEIESSDQYLPESSSKDTLVKVIIESSAEIKPELTQIFDCTLEEGKSLRIDSNYDLCQALISSNLEAISIIKTLPEYVLKFADLFWFDQEKKNSYDSMGTEKYFSLSKRREYFPASAYQTPIYWLLHYAFEITVEFILKFTNKSIKSYVNSGFDDSVEEVILSLPNGQKHSQFLTDNLWNMYRGTGSPVVPYLLQSIHMALEKYLLELAVKEDSEIIESKLIYLVENSISASISSVVTSVVLSQPNKLFNVAKILFSSISFMLCDRIRALSGEHRAKGLVSIGFAYDQKKSMYKNERVKTFEQKHRSQSLEGLILNFQFFKDKGISQEIAEQRKNEIWEIIDDLYKALPKKGNETDKDKTNRLLLARIDRRKMKPKVDQQEDKILIDFNPQIDDDLEKHSQEAITASNDFLKYTGLHMWASNKFNRDNNHANNEEYENNPKLVLKETKELIASLNSEDVGTFRSMNRSIPAFSCSALVREYSSSLSKEDLEFCKQIIIEYATNPLTEGYRYQISDGSEVAINAIPSLFSLFPESHSELLFLLLLIIFDTHPISGYKRVCDYSIESIQRSLWDSHPEKAKKVVAGYIKFKLRYNKVKKEVRQLSIEQNGQPNYTQTEILNKFIERDERGLEKFFASSNNSDKYSPVGYSIGELGIIFLLIPNNTKDPQLISLVLEILPIFAKKLLEKDRKVDYSLRTNIFKKYAYFVLNQEISLTKQYCQPFVDEFRTSEHTARLFEEFISAEDVVRKYDQFWKVWESFYNQVIKQENHRGYNFSHLIQNYLLAWNYWSKGTKNWHSLGSREKVFYKKIVADIGHLPAVFESIAKFLDQVGSEFLDEGVFWITDLILKNSTNKLEKNTIYYVEQLTRKYVYLNRNEIRKNDGIKTIILIILNFLIENGSVNAYLLREDVI